MDRLCVFLNLLSLTAALLCVSLISAGIFMSVFVMLTVFFINMPGSLLTAMMFVFLCISMGLFIFLAWKFGRNKLVFEESRSRGQSFLLWGTPAFLLFSLLLFISFYTDLDLPVLIGLSLPVIALILSAAFPFPVCRDRFWKAVRGIGFAGALLFFFFGSLYIGRVGKEVSYRGNDPAGLESIARKIRGAVQGPPAPNIYQS